MMKTELRFRPVQRQTLQRRDRAMTMVAPPPNLTGTGNGNGDPRIPYTRERSLSIVHPLEYSIQPPTLLQSPIVKRQSAISNDSTTNELEDPSEQTLLQKSLERGLGVALDSASKLRSQRMDVGLKAEIQFKTLASLLGYKLEPVSVSHI
jgi:hypothetical protein